jgi:hypothetical protein
LKVQQPQILKSNNRSQHSQNSQNTTDSQVAFKGAAAFTQFLTFLETNQAWGATAVDCTCMGLPRTLTDFTRGPDAGIETARREFSSTVIDAGIGAYGLGAAYLISQGLNRKYGLKGDAKANKMMADNDTLAILGQIYDDKKPTQTNLNDLTRVNESKKAADKQLHNSLQEVIGRLKGFNPDKKSECDEKGWVGIKNHKQRTKIVNILEESIKNGSKKEWEETKKLLSALIIDQTGAERNIKIEKIINGKPKSIVAPVDEHLDSIYHSFKTFSEENVTKTFKNFDIANNPFLNYKKSLNKYAAILGVATAVGLGCSMQPLNMYLTKKKTGKSGFVGVEGREPDKSKGFKLLKLGVAGAAGLALMLNISKKPSQILNKIQFKGLVPTLPQFKLVYGLVVLSRMLSARDKNELRETSIKDTLGFANWLIFGGFASKLAAAGVEKLKGNKYIRYNKAENGEHWFDWLTKSSIVSRAEVLYEDLVSRGIKTITKAGKALTQKEMMNKASEPAKNKMKWINIIQLAGYAWSGLALGFGIPKLNIAITNAVEKKRKAKEAEAPKVSSEL